MGGERERGRGVAARLEEYRLHARLPAFRRKLERAKEAVHLAQAAVPGVWAVSFSGGKDSAALLHVCLEAGWRGPVLHFFYEETPEENTAFVRRLAEAHGLELHILRVPGAWDVYRETGSFFTVPGTEEEKRAARRMLKAYKEEVNRYAARQGWAGQFLGMRKEESRRRLMALARKGILYRTQDRLPWTCCPLAEWSARDVWAYIVARDLPYLSLYDTASNPERERSEPVWLACDRAWSDGQAVRLKRERPEEYRMLMLRFPDLQKLV